MSVSATGTATPPEAPPPAGRAKDRPKQPSKTRVTLVWLIGAAIFIACVYVVEAKWARLWGLPPVLSDYIKLMAQGVWHWPGELVDPSDPSGDTWGRYWISALDAMLESLYMAWIGTVIGAAISFPLGFLAAANVSPAPVVFVTRQFLNAIRAVPELVLAIVVMLPIFGLGPLSGALALGVGSVGTLGKLTSEVIEGIDPGPVEAARAAGARPLQVLRWAIIPQVLPETVAFWLYRFEINIRAGAILGALGAGGIGSQLVQLFDHRLWGRIGITLVVIIVLTIVVDMISGKVRATIIRGPVTKDPHSEAQARLDPWPV